MSRFALLNRIASIRQSISVDRPALRIPLLLLYALGRVQQRLPRLQSYNELEPPIDEQLPGLDIANLAWLGVGTLIDRVSVEPERSP